MLACVIIVFELIGCNDHSEKQVNLPLADTLKHSIPIQSPMDNVIQAYAYITEALVNWDSIGVKAKAIEFQKKLDSTELELSKDSVLQDKEITALFNSAKKNVGILEKQKSITQQRHELDALSKTLFQLLKSMPGKSPDLYLQVCPMAFNDVDSGYWLSKSNNIRNPYMGLHHPRYHGGMLSCGENMDSINQSK